MKIKINKKDFESVFTNRKLTKHERYLQTFWLETDNFDNYWIRQGYNFPMLIFINVIAVVALPIVIAASLILNGLSGVKEILSEISLLSWKKNAIRLDYLHSDNLQSKKIIELTVKQPLHR